VQGLWGGPYLTEVLGLTREGAGAMLMWTSVGFIAGSVLMDKVARRLFHSYKWALIAGQCCLLLLMTGFLGWLDGLSRPFLGIYFFGVGCAVSSGIMIYPIIRASFPVSIVGTALTSLNFFVLMGAAMAQQGMGLVVERMGGYSAQAFHAAFAVPVAGLLLAILLYLSARDCPAA
jgi:sugar phosphate permease